MNNENPKKSNHLQGLVSLATTYDRLTEVKQDCKNFKIGMLLGTILVLLICFVITYLRFRVFGE